MRTWAMLKRIIHSRTWFNSRWKMWRPNSMTWRSMTLLLLCSAYTGWTMPRKPLKKSTSLWNLGVCSWALPLWKTKSSLLLGKRWCFLLDGKINFLQVIFSSINSTKQLISTESPSTSCSTALAMKWLRISTSTIQLRWLLSLKVGSRRSGTLFTDRNHLLRKRF